MPRSSDTYFWLRDRSNPEVLEYLKSENEYTERMMRHTRELREKLYREMCGHIQQADQSAPVKRGDYLYYSRTEEGRQYEIHCRKKTASGSSEEILLDVNRIAEGHRFCEPGTYQISPDHRLLAYSVDTSGRERYTLYIKDLVAGETIVDGIPNTHHHAVWSRDSTSLFYIVLDQTYRPYLVMRHHVGSSAAVDEIIYEETDPAFRVSLSRTRSYAYILLRSESLSSTEVRYLPGDDPDAPFRVFCPRRDGLEYYLLHQENRFLILTNDNALNFRLMEAPVADPSRENWREVIGHRESVYLEDAEVLKHHLVLFERENGLNNLRIINCRDGSDHYIDFPETLYLVRSGHNPEFDTSVFRFIYTSLITPECIFEYDMNKSEQRLLKQEPVLGGYDPADYESRRLFAFAEDGVMVPISMVHRKGVAKDSANPLVLYGYGAYGESIEPEFDSTRLSLLDRGFIYAVAHVRGGSEFGRQWYEDGRLLNKMNTFTDFIACAEYLIAEKYTAPDKMIFAGFSAGGLLIGSVINMRSDLCAAAVADVPFVDVISSMRDQMTPLTVTEYDEWGNPIDAEILEYMSDYSPVDNVAPQDYPNLFIRAAMNDPRVQYWEPAVWAMKLRQLKTDDNLLLLRTHMHAGHFGPSGRYDYIKELAYEYAFMLDVLGIEA